MIFRTVCCSLKGFKCVIQKLEYSKKAENSRTQEKIAQKFPTQKIGFYQISTPKK